MQKIKEIIKQNEKEFVSENNIEYTTILKKAIDEYFEADEVYIKSGNIFVYSYIAEEVEKIKDSKEFIKILLDYYTGIIEKGFSNEKIKYYALEIIYNQLDPGDDFEDLMNTLGDLSC